VHGIRDQLGAGLEEILVVFMEAGGVLRGVLEHELAVRIQVHDRRGIGGGKQQRRARAGVDEPVPGVQRRPEERAGPPFEDSPLAAALAPHLGAAAAFKNDEELLVHVFLGVQLARGRHLDDVHALDAEQAVKGDETATAA